MNTIRFVLGLVMIGLGGFLFGHLVWTRGAPTTPSIWLDLVAMAYCFLRGILNLRSWRAKRAQRDAVAR